MISSLSLTITLIAIFCSISCVLLGTFLVLRGVALMSDAISHAILPGIVIMFLWVKNLNSPWLLIGAAGAGLATVVLTEHILHTRRLNKDTAIGLVFPLFFSIGIILISLYTRTIHLDVDMVLLGELAFAPFDRLHLFSYDLGPAALWIMGFTALCNALFVWLFYKQLIVATFDQTFATVIGYRPKALYYALMTMTSITAVTAFNVVGSIVVVALMLAPPAAAYLVAEQLHTLLITALILGASAALAGCSMAQYADVSLAGSIAVANGVIFFIVLLIAPKTGILATWISQSKKPLS